MDSDKTDSASPEALEHTLQQLVPALDIKIRTEFTDGLSKAAVYLVSCQIDEEHRFGALKLVSPEKADQELHGYQQASASWLKPFLSDHCDKICTLTDGTVVLLSSLVRDRIADCRTLKYVLSDSFPFGLQVLRTVAYAYRQEAQKQWSTGQSHTVTQYFHQPIVDHLGPAWLTRWAENGMPSKDYPAIVFDQFIERLPNPVAFFIDHQLWPGEALRTIQIPWIQSHGDLNPQNILCPSLARAAGQSLVNPHKRVVLPQLLEHVSLIDMPFCRSAPYPFDMAFLASWLSFHLLRFDSHAQRDTALATYRAVLHEVLHGTTPLNIPAEGANYAACLSTIWKELASFSAPFSKMKSDLELSYLAALSCSSLWLAIKNIDKHRLQALSALCFSALALKALLGDTLTRLRDPDFHIAIDKSSDLVWNDAAKNIGQRLERFRERKSLILILGTKWDTYTGLSHEGQELLNLEHNPKPEEIRRLLAICPESAVAPRLSAIGTLPLVAIIDWCVSPCLREAISRGLPTATYFSPYLSGPKAPDWSDRKCIMYCHWRGSLEEVSSLACSAPKRAKSRVTLRDGIGRFSKERPQKLTILYVGTSGKEVSELHEYLQEIWDAGLGAIYVGPAESSMTTYFQEWDIETITGTIQDFLTACADFAHTVPMSSATAASRRLLQIAGMNRDEEGELYVSPKNILPVEVTTDDHEAISRAGYLVLKDDFNPSIGPARDPRAFFIGHRIDFSEIQRELLIERDNFNPYFNVVQEKLSTRQTRPLMVIIPSRPGAGASTTLRWIAYHTATELHIPTLVLQKGGTTAFEAIERLYLLVGRSLLVVADPEDVPLDELRGVVTRCMPSGHPILFLTSSRVLQERREYDAALPLLDIRLSGREKQALLKQLRPYCMVTSLIRIGASNVMSLFLLLLEAFGGDNIRIEWFVSSLLEDIPQRQRCLVATVAFFFRYAHRACSDDFLQLLNEDYTAEEIQKDLEPFDQLLILRQGDGWVCRHDELTRAILEYHLIQQITRTGSWRYKLASFVCDELINRLDGAKPGGNIAADYIWSLLNPQHEPQGIAGMSYRSTGTRRRPPQVPQESRLLWGDDGVPENVMRDLIFKAAAEHFSTHLQIVAHYGKFLSEKEQKFVLADRYLMQAHELNRSDETVIHMIGKRYYDEAHELLRRNPPRNRSEDAQERIDMAADEAHRWFDQARDKNLGSEYNYTTPIQLNVALIEDELKRLGVRSVSEKTEVLLEDRISTLMTHSERLVAEGLRYISPLEQERLVFTYFRDQLHDLRGDLDTAIECFQRRLPSLSGSHLFNAKMRLARYHLERAENRWRKTSNLELAYTDFKAGEAYASSTLQDPKRQGDNIRLWFDCARYLPNWNRQRFLDRLHQLHEHKDTLDSSFLLMCWYFADALETGSTHSWRKCQEFQTESARRAANFGVRNFTREWLVEVDTDHGKEYRIYPSHLFPREDVSESASGKSPAHEYRVRCQGFVSKYQGPTAAYLKLEPMGYELFFKPRVHGREFYRSDEQKRTRVTCLVAFTYDKPVGFNTTRVKAG